MTNVQKIKMALAFIGMSESDLARKLGTTPQAFNQRMKTDKFSTDELERIAAALGAVYTSSFTFPDGTNI
ncbi:MAG: helix-turn-helix transcriptional regulator [Firmicutes bacterium]|nr:helix-turn-helix transcriptional regulator [Bacillota bacterium]